MGLRAFGDGAVRLVLGTGLSTPQQDIDLSSAALAGPAAPDTEIDGSWLRVHRPAPTAAFSRMDALAPGHAHAAAAASKHGFAPILRPAGGRLAAYHRDALVLDLVARHPEPHRHIRERFAQLGGWLVDVLTELGVDARLGEVAGEYCPGEFSVNAGGKTKLVGTAQRVTRLGFLISAVLLVADPEPVRAVLTDAYPLLGLAWDPTTVGCVADSVPGVTTDEVRDAILARLPRLLPGVDH